MKVVVIGSTSGSVIRKVIQHSFARNLISEVVSDRPCGLLELANEYGIQHNKFLAANGCQFSDMLSGYYQLPAGLIFLSFYTRLFSHKFIKATGRRIFNCHPSFLPSFKGLNGFQDTLSSSAMFMGCTLHQIDEDIDSGNYLIQGVYPLNRDIPPCSNRHILFLMQYYTTLQFFKWVYEGRLLFDAKCAASVTGLRYTPSLFSPNLDGDLFEFANIENELL